MSGGQAAISLPAAQLHPEVMALLHRLYSRADTASGTSSSSSSSNSSKGCHLEQTLQRLAAPPALTTLRVNTFKVSRAACQTVLQAHVNRTFLSATVAAPNQSSASSSSAVVLAAAAGSTSSASTAVSPHSLFDDVLTLPCTGPHSVVPVAPPSPAAAAVFVDRTCGCSVLRGAPVFAMGTVAAGAAVADGKAVSVYMLMNDKMPAGNDSTAAATSSDATAVSSAVFVANGVARMSADVLNQRLWHALRRRPGDADADLEADDDAEGDTDSSIPLAAAALTAITAPPAAATATRAVAAVAQGMIAVTITDAIYRSPSLYAIEKGQCQCGCGWQSRTGTVLLQNIPSMCAVRALAPLLGERVLDMCAAPGGKTSHIATLMSSTCSTPSGNTAKTNAGRAASLKRLLREWTSADSVDAKQLSSAADAASSLVRAATSCTPAVHVLAATNALDLLGTNHKGNLKRRAGAVTGTATPHRNSTGAPTVSSTASPSALPLASPSLSLSLPLAGESFDRILLDPPCSGLGQRPHFKSAGQSVAALRGCGLYQRQLMTVAYGLLRAARDGDASDSGGVLVFSTCTLSPFENEANVAWFLRRYPDMQLVQSRPTHVLSDTKSNTNKTDSNDSDMSVVFGSAALPVTATDLGLDPLSLEPALLSPTVTGTATTNADTPLLTPEQRALCQRFEPVTHDTIAFFIAKFCKRTVTTSASATASASATGNDSQPLSQAEVRAARLKRKQLEKEQKAFRVAQKRMKNNAGTTSVLPSNHSDNKSSTQPAKSE